MIDKVKALRDPAAVFRCPQDVLLETTISLAEKRDILMQWEVDAKELLVAEEENMVGDGPSMLSRVHIALADLANQSE